MNGFDRRRHRRVALTLAAAAVAVAGSSSLIAQVNTVVEEAAAPAKPAETTVGIFVNDSAIAAEKLTLAQRMERAREWDTSAEVYQEIVDRYADRVIATHNDASGRADRYGGVATVVQDRLSAWPAEGQQVYLDRYDAPAAKLLEGMADDDVIGLSAVIDRYFITGAGRDAAMRLVRRYFETGQFVAAGSLADRLIDHHPGLAAEGRALLLLQSSLSWRLAGDVTRAGARAATLAESFPEARAMLGGSERSLSELANEELNRATVTLSTRDPNRWTEAFGSPDHATVAAEPAANLPPSQPRQWARLLTMSLDPSPVTLFSNPQQAQAFGLGANEMPPADAASPDRRNITPVTGILPAVDGEAVFFQDNARVYARSLATGDALPGWQATYPADDGRYRLAEAQPTPRGGQMTVALAGPNVVAILGQVDPVTRMMAGGSPAARPVITCLDRTTGAVRWAMKMADLKLPGETAPQPATPDRPAAEGAAATGAVQQTDPCGSVLVVDDAVYVRTRGGNSRMGETGDAYLVCLNLADGSPRWIRHLASANSGRSQFGFDPSTMLSDVADSHAAYADGRIYACTDQGALAAIDASDGSVAWISAYPKPAPENVNPWIQRTLRGSTRPEPAYAGNPVIVRDGKVVTLPIDSEFLFVHDALDGRELARIRLKGKFAGEQHADQADVLVGMNGDHLVLSSGRALTVLDWAKVTHDLPNADAAPREWAIEDVLKRRKLLSREGYEDDGIRGRPCLTERSVFVPTAWRLLRFDLDTLLARDQYPATEDWDSQRDEAPGNVTVVGERILVAGPRRLSVFAELSQLRQKLDAQIAAAPDNLSLRRQYAEALFNAGQEAEALAMIDTAIERLEANASTADTDRAALLGLTLSRLRTHFTPDRSQTSTANAPSADTIAAGRALLQRATLLARSPEQQVAARVAGATIARAAGEAATAVELYQSILDDATLARVGVRNASGDGNAAPDATSGQQPLIDAGTLARQLIDRVLSAAGDGERKAYAGIEARAAAALAAARTAGPESPQGQPPALFAIARQYPNASAAKEAIELAGQILTRPSDGAPERRALRELAAQAADPNARVALSESIARSYLADDDVSGALGRLRRLAGSGDASRSLSTPLPDLADGTSLADASTVATAIERLQAIAFERQERRLPDLGANLEGNSFAPDATLETPDIARLLLPTNREAARTDRVVALGRGAKPALKILRPGSAEPIAQVDWTVASDGAIAPSWIDADRLLLRQRDQVACVDVGGSRIAWSLDLAKLDAPSADAAEIASDADDATTPERLVEIDRSGIGLVQSSGVTLAGSAPAAEVVDPLELQLRQQLIAGGAQPAMIEAIIQQQRAAQRAQRPLRGINGGQLIVAPGGRLVVNGQVIGPDGNLATPSWRADPRDADAAERIVDARLPHGAARDVVVIVTSRGRLIGVDRQTGAIRWRTRVAADRAPGSVAVVDDRIVCTSTDERTSRLIVVDAVTGKTALRRTVADAAGTPGKQILSLSAGEEGYVVLVQADGLSCYDIGGGDPEPIATQPISVRVPTVPLPGEQAVQAPGAAGGRVVRNRRVNGRLVRDASVSSAGSAISALAGQENVLFCGDRVLVLSSAAGGDNGETPVVRAFELSTLKPITTTDAKTRQSAEQQFVPAFADDRRTGTEPLTLRVHKDRLFIGTGYFLKSYPVLDGKALPWTRTPAETPTMMTAASPMLVRDGAIVIGWPKQYVGLTSPVARLELYSRQRVDDQSEEVGMLVEDLELNRKGRAKLVNDAFQPVDGGLYYLGTDGVLVFLPGKRGE